MDFIVVPFAFLLRLFYNMFNSYLFSLFMFTFVIRIAMIPSSISGQKMQAKNMFMTSKMNKLKERYKDDKAKLQKAQQELMMQEGNNPLKGCLPMFLPLIILWPVFRIIYDPLTHILQIPQTQIDSALKILDSAKIAVGNNKQFAIMDNIDKLTGMGADFVSKVKEIDINYFGIELTKSPSFSKVSIYWIIPIVAALTSFLYSKFTASMSKQSGMANPANSGMMFWMMPIMSLFMCFNFPAGMGFYWIFSNIVGFFIQYFVNKMYNPLAINSRTEISRRKARITVEEKVKNN